MTPIDGALRCVKSQHVNDKIWILPYGGRGLYLYDGAVWTYSQISGQLEELDKNDCTIDGVAHQTLTTATNYWIYAYLVSGVVHYEFSTQAPTTWDASSGFVTKPNDLTRRLIGGCNYINTTVGFGINQSNQCVASYFNRLEPNLDVVLTSGSASGSWTELTGANTRAYGWMWGDSVEPLATLSGSITGQQAGVPCYVGISLNGANPPARKSIYVPAVANGTGSFCVQESTNANFEGLHQWSIMMKRESFGTQTVYVNPEIHLTVKYRS